MSLRVVLKERRGGKGTALVEGFKHVTGDVVLIQDADLEYDPVDYPKLLAPIVDGRADDVVSGSRFMSGERSVLLFWNTVANKILTLVANFCSNLNLTDVLGPATRSSALKSSAASRSSRRDSASSPRSRSSSRSSGAASTRFRSATRDATTPKARKSGSGTPSSDCWTTFATALWGELGELAVGEQTLQVMANAGRYNRLIREMFAPHMGKNVVEIGAPVGNVSRFLLDAKKLTLTDTDPIYACPAISSATSASGTRVEGPEARPPAASRRHAFRGTFDTAVCFQRRRARQGSDATALRNLRRLLMPGGRLLVIVPAHQWLFGTLDVHLGHHRRYEKEGLEEKLKIAGFETEHSQFSTTSPCRGGMSTDAGSSAR